MYPSFQIVGYQGVAVCVVSLVEHEAPYRAHPHNLVGKDGIFLMSILPYSLHIFLFIANQLTLMFIVAVKNKVFISSQ